MTASGRGLRISARWLFDGQNPPISDGAVLVEDGRITAAGPAGAVPSPPGTDALDLGDRALLPGLIDAHLHLQGYRPGDPDWPDRAFLAMRAVADARHVLESGFTTVRDCGSAHGIALRRAVEEGTVVGPRVLSSGPIISQTGGHGDWREVPPEHVDALRDERLVVDGPVAARKAVRTAVRAGADLVKICTSGGVGTRGDHMNDAHFTPDEIEAMVDEAHRSGRRVAAHAQGRDGVLNAVRAGVDSIEHGYFIDERCLDEMLAHGTALVPTFGLIRSFRAGGEDRPAWLRDKQQECVDAMLRSFPMAVSAGVPIGTGSDNYGTPGRELGRSADELVAMVEDGGADPLDVLRSATSVGAQILGVDHETGTLEPGKSADLVAVGGTPWTSIDAVREVDFVLARGTVVTAPPVSPAITGS